MKYEFYKTIGFAQSVGEGLQEGKAKKNKPVPPQNYPSPDEPGITFMRLAKSLQSQWLIKFSTGLYEV